MATLDVRPCEAGEKPAGRRFGSHYNRHSKHSTIRSAAFPSQSRGIAPFFHCPAIKCTRLDRLVCLVCLVCLVHLVEQDSRVDHTNVMLKPPISAHRRCSRPTLHLGTDRPIDASTRSFPVSLAYAGSHGCPSLPLLARYEGWSKPRIFTVALLRGKTRGRGQPDCR